MDKCIVKRPRQFDLAVKSLYSQSLFSSSTHSLEFAGRGFPMKSSTAISSESDVGFRGRGRPAFIPQEILDQPVRRPASTVPPPLPSHLNDSVSSKNELTQFRPLFSGKLVDDIVVYRTMEAYVFDESRSLHDLQKMMQTLSVFALDCHRNVPTICKYLYVFSQDPNQGSDLRNAFFSNLEFNFLNREDLKKREGPSRYRNFIRWVMAAAHHYRNLLYAPFDELMLSLLDLANEISEFNDLEDIPLYVTLILRFYYYTSLPCSDGTDVSAKLGEQHVAAIVKARNHVRQRVARGGLSVVHVNWLLLLLEVTRSSPSIDQDLIEYYEKILPGFSLLRQETLKIKLPEGCSRARHLEHISRFVSW